jgi:hypothetical protein
MDGDDGSGGVLGRGWTPSKRVRATAFLLVGALLLAHPLVGGLPDAAGLTGNAEYTAAEVRPDDGAVDFRWLADHDRSVSGELVAEGGLPLIDCLPDDADLSYCALEAPLTDRNATLAREPPTWSGYTYHGRFYERRVLSRSGNTTVGLSPVAAETVLEDVAIPRTSWSEPVRRAVEQGRVTAEPRVESVGVILADGGEYYLVLPTSSVPDDEPPGPLYTAAFTAAGLGLLRRGWRQYPD